MEALSDGTLTGKKTLKDLQVFEEDVLSVAQTDKVHPLFEYFAENLADVSAKLCFVKTDFHHVFLEKIITARNNYGYLEKMVGVQGIGKSSSTLYYVLRCRKEGDTKLHYVDLKYIEKNDKKLEKFTLYVENIKLHNCLIIDHVTLFNMHLVHKIQELLPLCKVILIETGFTASNKTHSLDTENDKTLDEAEFLKIWEGTLEVRPEKKAPNLKSLGQDVYNELRDNFLLTPRLLHRTMSNMLLKNITIEELALTTLKENQFEIAEFKKKLDACPLPEYEPFILHTRLLLNCLEDKAEVICTDLQAAELNIAINIFKVKKCVATKEDFSKDHRFLDSEMEEGTRYKKISLLEPGLGLFWKTNFPLEHTGSSIMTLIHVKSVLEFYLRNGNIQKTFEELLVSFQEKCKSLIIPEEVINESHFSELSSACRLEYEQTIQTKLSLVPSLSVLRPTLNCLKEIMTEEKYEGHTRNIYRTAIFIKTNVERNIEQPLLIYPKVENLMGFDYFVYAPLFSSAQQSNSDPVPNKRSKVQGKLYLVQVATGATRGGNTMAKALPVFKEILTDMIVHVIVMIIRKDTNNFTLTGNFRFSNISFINLASEIFIRHVDVSLKSLIEVLRDVNQ